LAHHPPTMLGAGYRDLTRYESRHTAGGGGRKTESGLPPLAEP
jgi:hypothetical protein